MIKLKYFGAFFMMVCLLSTYSCTDLSVIPADSIVAEGGDSGFIPGDPAELLNSSYKDFAAFTDQNNMYALGTHTSDEMIPPTRGVDWGDNGVWRTLHAHNWDETHTSVLGAWNSLHGNAYKTNEIIASSPDQAQEAEAKFLRAFFMFHAMDFFGQVPFREVTEGPDVDPKVLTRVEAFNFIKSDLEAALPNLPSVGPSPTNARASKATAYFLLARLHLNAAVYNAADPVGPYTYDAADMNKVIEYVDLIAAEGYDLDTDYFNIFTANESPEIILTSAEGSAQNRWMMTLHYGQNPSGWNGFATLADFYDKFDDDNDGRKFLDAKKDGTEFAGIGKGFLVGQQFDKDGVEVIDERSQKPLQFSPDVPLAGAATEKGIRVIKYHPADAGQYILMRYGAAHMMKAEAIHRGGSASKSALEMVNDLRTARGASALASIDDASLLDELGRETYWEGYRRSDQIRFGTFANEWSFKSVTENTRVLFPIPIQALASNPNLTQNAGY